VPQNTFNVHRRCSPITRALSHKALQWLIGCTIFHCW
jgi:hypothetical protein